MVVIVLTIEETPRGVVFNTSRLSKKENETEVEAQMMRCVDAGMFAAQTEILRATTEYGANHATVIEGKNITEAASKMARKLLATDVFKALDKAGFKT